MITRRTHVFAALVASALLGRAALAQPTPAPGDTPAPNGDALPEKGKAPTEEELAKNKMMNERPWAKGVSAEEQQKALVLFGQANSFLRDAIFPRAAEKYREALDHWKHPAIYYNLALALVNLNQPVEMYQALEKAMAYGAAPLDEDKFQRAKGYKILVEGQLAKVELTCDTPGAEVFLDGKSVIKAPGKYDALIVIGEHTVLAKGEGYAPTQLVQKMGPKETMRLNLKLFTDAELTRYKRKMPTWVPYTVMGGGALVGVLSAVLHANASSDFKNYDTAIANCATGDASHGCSTAGTLESKKASAETKQTMAFVGYSVAGVALATGITLMVINRPSAYRIDPFAEVNEPGKVSIVPVIGPDGGGVSAFFRF
ncbi:MAG: hypothetical protein K8W52_24245 [Deltaproteobacteria bacterium]|nr:hypothetical protein [Deltaproteobacteria bacterium]